MQKSFVKIVIILMVTCILGAFGNFKVEANIVGKRVKYIKQIINGKKEYVGCNMKSCAIHKVHDYGKCATGSDLLKIQVDCGSGNKSIYDNGFKSLQGSCIKNNHMFIMFSKKGNENRTLVVKINLKNNEVVDYFGESEEFYALGHANDMTKKSNYFHVPWYQTNGKKEYSNMVGFIKDDFKEDGQAKKVGKQKKLERNSPFGIAKNGKKLTIGFRDTFYKSKYKLKKDKYYDIKRYIKKYTFKEKKGKYKYVKKSRIKIPKNKTFGATQCFELFKSKYYIVRFNDAKGKKNNNCVHIINKKGKTDKIITISDPKDGKVQVLKKNAKLEKNTISEIKKNCEKKKIKWKSKLWEVETICHYKKRVFYYTQYKSDPKKTGKQAYLYYATIK